MAISSIQLSTIKSLDPFSERLRTEFLSYTNLDNKFLFVSTFPSCIIKKRFIRIKNCLSHFQSNLKHDKFQHIKLINHTKHPFNFLHYQNRIISSSFYKVSSFEPTFDSETRFLFSSSAWRYSAPISGSDTWQIWTIILLAASLGLWSEKTQWGKMLSAPLVSTLLGLAASNSGLIPCEAMAYRVINTFLLPLSVPLLLMNADLKRVVKDTGRLLTIFLLGSLGTVMGTIIAFKFLPLTSLGNDSWKIAAALMSRHIGGAVNYVAVTEALSASPSVVTAGLAADNLICAIYFTSLFVLASDILPESSNNTNEEQKGSVAQMDESKGSIQVLEGSIAIAISSLLCTCGNLMTKHMHWKGGSIPCITALTVLIATLFPRQLSPISSSASGLAILLMQVFFVSVGANGNISAVMNTAPSLFLFSFLQIAIHLAIIFGFGKLLGYEKREILLASNANVGGPATGASMAAAKGWSELLVPTILVGIAGYAIATFVSLAIGYSVLSKM